MRDDAFDRPVSANPCDLAVCQRYCLNGLQKGQVAVLQNIECVHCGISMKYSTCAYDVVWCRGSLNGSNYSNPFFHFSERASQHRHSIVTGEKRLRLQFVDEREYFCFN